MSKKYLVSLWLTGILKMNKRLTHIDSGEREKWEKWEWMIKLSTHMCVISKPSDILKKTYKADKKKSSTKFPEFKRL